MKMLVRIRYISFLCFFFFLLTLLSHSLFLSFVWPSLSTQIFVTMEGTLIEASGRGFLYSTSCGSLSTFYLEALLATPIIFSHIMQTILAFKAIREEDKKMVGIVLASHLIPSLFSILNSVGVEGLCALSLLSSYASTAALGYFTFKDMKEKSIAR